MKKKTIYRKKKVKSELGESDLDSSIINQPMGSKEWVDLIFSTPPVRELKGPSKPTQYHQAWVPSLGRLVGAQGRNETCSLIALEYLMNLKIIRCFKEQPFRTTEAEFGSQIVPDYFAEEVSGNLHVIETKVNRFVTNLIQKKLDSNREKFQEFGLNYVVWMDTWPLTKHVRHNLINMRKASMSHISEEERNFALTKVKDAHTTTLGKLYRDGISLDCIYALAWSGRIFFNISAELVEESFVSIVCREDYRKIFLFCRNHADTWWDELQSD